MTTITASPAVAAETVAAAIATVRAHGLRVSTSRRMVLEALFRAEAPVSAERIAGGLDGHLPPLDLASVYRNLETLESLGVARHLHVGHGPRLYTLAGRVCADYLVCGVCSAVHPVDPGSLDPVRTALRDSTGWDARFTHFPIVGSCPACLEDGG